MSSNSNTQTKEPKILDLEVEPGITASKSDEGVGLESTIYKNRFSLKEEKVREITWQVLCQQFFSKWISKNDSVLDLGAGDGLFIRNIEATRKIAVDLSEHVLLLQSNEIEVNQIPASEMALHYKEQIDVVFMSNFLEHLPSKHVLLDVLKGANEVLKPGARVLILQPNIRYVKAAYWDYIDHHIALTEHSLTEALNISGFEVEHMIPRFLPYTAKSKTGNLAAKLDTKKVIETYLNWPVLWKIFGGQTFVVAKKVQ